MIEKYIYILYIEFESEEISIFHVFTDREQGEEMKERMKEHAKKHKLKENFYLAKYKIVL